MRRVHALQAAASAVTPILIPGTTGDQPPLHVTIPRSAPKKEKKSVTDDPVTHSFIELFLGRFP